MLQYFWTERVRMCKQLHHTVAKIITQYNPYYLQAFLFIYLFWTSYHAGLSQAYTYVLTAIPAPPRPPTAFLCFSFVDFFRVPCVAAPAVAWRVSQSERAPLTVSVRRAGYRFSKNARGSRRWTFCGSGERGTQLELKTEISSVDL